MYINDFEGSIMEMELQQIDGAHVDSIDGVQYHISFEMQGDYRLSFVYHVNTNRDYFLQRVSPYPHAHGRFYDEKDVVDFIKTDVIKFRNAEKSSNYSCFVESTQKVQVITSAMEELFLNHNVDCQKLNKIDTALQTILDEISRFSDTTELIKIEDI